MSDPNGVRETSATIKMQGKDQPWIVFRGTVAAVREQIIEACGMNEEAAGMNLVELVTEAQRIMSGVSNVAAGLGGRVLSSGNGGSAWEAAASGQRAEEKPAKSEAELNIERLTAEVEKQTSVADLQQVWARNQAAFQDAALMAAYKAKGKALTSAAA